MCADDDGYLLIELGAQHKWISVVLASYVNDQMNIKIPSSKPMENQSYYDYSIINGVIKFQGRVYTGKRSELRLKFVPNFHDFAFGCLLGDQMITGLLLWPLLQTTSSITQVVHDSTMSVHDSTMSGQIGLPITYQRLIYGLAMKGDVISLVNCCDVCEMAKSEHFLYPWLLQGLSFLKYWYDTSYHTSLKMSPFTGLYGYTPPFITLYLYLDSIIAAIKNQIKDRFQTLEFIKANTLQVQYIVKVYIDKKRFGRSFEVGEENYLEFILLTKICFLQARNKSSLASISAFMQSLQMLETHSTN